MKEPIKEKLKSILNKPKSFSIDEIKYFSSDGAKSIPNGHPIEKGGFIRECSINSQKFAINNNHFLIKKNFDIIEATQPNQYDFSNYDRGIIVFSTNIDNLEISKSRLRNWFEEKGLSLIDKFITKSKLSENRNKLNYDDKVSIDGNIDDYIGSFSIGNFFSGKYTGDYSLVFDEKSLSIEVSGISSNGLIHLAEEIVKEFNLKTVLIKDFNIKKIFSVNQLY